MPLIIALVLIGVLGAGGGIGIRSMLGDGAGADTAAATDDKAEGEAAAEEGGHGEKPAGEKKEAKEGGGHGEAEAGAEEAEVLLDEEPPDNLAEMVVTPMEPVITNIAKPKTVWVRLEGSILSRAGSEVKPQVLAAQAAQQVVAYLRTIDIHQIEGANGLLHVNEDLNDIAKTFSNGSVRQILISGLIVE